MEITQSRKTAVVFGGTGLVGSYLLPFLCRDNLYQKVIAYVRTEPDFKDEKLIVRKLAFKHIESELDALEGDDLFICLGTTMKKAGSKKAFKHVDQYLITKIAAIAASKGVNQLLLISAVGADKDSVFFYSRVKGEVEEEVKKMNFWAIHLFQPSLLLGERNENRFGEKIAGFIGRGLDFISGNLLKKYKPVEAEVVAKSMVSAAQRFQKGVFTYPSDQLQDLVEEYYSQRDLL